MWAHPRRNPRSAVRRGSILVHNEGPLWAPYPGTRVWETQNYFKDIIESAELLTEERKAKGKRHGGLGYVAIRILKLFCRIVDFRKGRLDPSYLYIQEKTGFSIDAIARALKQLRDLGFIHWRRRYRRDTNDEGKPISVQISNAYRIEFPEAAKEILARKRPKAPPPECAEHREEQLEKDRERVLRALGCEGSTKAIYGTGVDPMGDALAKVGAGVDKNEAKRDSAMRREPVP